MQKFRDVSALTALLVATLVACGSDLEGGSPKAFANGTAEPEAAPATSSDAPPLDVPEVDEDPPSVIGGASDEETQAGSFELEPAPPLSPPVLPSPPQSPAAPSAASDALIRGDAPTAQSVTRAGPYDVSTLSSGLRDGPAYGTQTLHVPVGAEPPFAGVAIVPGFISPESSIRAWGPFLASHGIVTLTIGTNSGGDLPDARARALLDAIETLKAEHVRSGGPVQGQLALDRFAVMGWSMGGGGTLIAANQTPELRAAIGLAAWSPGARFAQNQVPTLLLAGSADALAGGQSQGFFESIPDGTPKLLFEVAGGPHDIANNPSSADGEIGRYGLSWLKVFLGGDERYRPFLLETPSNESDFRVSL